MRIIPDKQAQQQKPQVNRVMQEISEVIQTALLIKRKLMQQATNLRVDKQAVAIMEQDLQRR